jgi:hypothetical protein
MEVKDKTTDIYVQKLNDQIEILQKCQKEHHIGSCTKCKDFIGCDIRKSYVNAVYQSMNKGAGGGFEF